MKDFTPMQEYLDELVTKDERIAKLLEEANLTPLQLKIVNTLIIAALRFYDDKTAK